MEDEWFILQKRICFCRIQSLLQNSVPFYRIGKLFCRKRPIL